MLNMTDEVTPNHFSAANFIPFNALSPAEEFDMVAPVMAFFFADLRLRPKAILGFKALKKAKHPLVEGLTVKELLETAPGGLVNRYNALVMQLVSEVAPSAEPYIDKYGAFGFRYNGQDGVLCGDASGMFDFYMSSAAIQKRFAISH